MVILDEVKRRLSELAPEVTDLHDALAIERSRVRLEELEQKSASPEFYDDAAASGAVFAEMGELKDRLEQYAALQTMLEDSETLLEMCAEDDDPALAEEADAAVNSLDAKVEELRLVTLLNGEYDANNAILTFHAGAGGTEAQDWVEMLYRMYTRFAARHNWTVKVLDYLEGDEAGIKSASILVEGHNAYGFCAAKTACTAWCVFRPSMPPGAAIPALPRWRSCRSWTTPSLWRSSRRTSKWRCSAPPARADSTSTRQAAPCVSSIFLRASW